MQNFGPSGHVVIKDFSSLPIYWFIYNNRICQLIGILINEVEKHYTTHPIRPWLLFDIIVIYR